MATRRVRRLRERFGIPRQYNDLREALAAEHPDFVDLITPPPTHLDLVLAAAKHGAHVFCQKPLAPTLAEARQLVRLCAAAGVRLMVHENFRFQPWHREIRLLLDAGTIGTRLHSLTFRSRPGDGWAPGAYLDRQPCFRTMPRLLIRETGVHCIDTFRYLAGEVARVYCLLRKLNPVIAGEDCGLLIFEFAGGAVGVWDANRYNDSNYTDPRSAFEFLVGGDGESIRLAHDGTFDGATAGQVRTAPRLCPRSHRLLRRLRPGHPAPPHRPAARGRPVRVPRRGLPQGARRAGSAL